MKELVSSSRKELEARSCKARRRSKQYQLSYGPAACRTFSGGCKNHRHSAKRAFKRRLWRLKHFKAPKSQEAWLGRRKLLRRDAKIGFITYFKQLNSNKPPKSHKAKGFKVPYRLPMTFATLNVRGLNGDSGITKRQIIVEAMKRENMMS